MGTPLDDDVEWVKKCGKDLDYFHPNYGYLCNKYRNEFVAVKNLKVYHDSNPFKMMCLLRTDSFDNEQYLYTVFKVMVILCHMTLHNDLFINGNRITNSKSNI